jgi:hypothetical protein
MPSSASPRARRPAARLSGAKRPQPSSPRGSRSGSGPRDSKVSRFGFFPAENGEQPPAGLHLPRSSLKRQASSSPRAAASAQASYSGKSARRQSFADVVAGNAQPEFCCPVPGCANRRQDVNQLQRHAREKHSHHDWTQEQLDAIGAQKCPNCGVLRSAKGHKHKCGPAKRPPGSPACRHPPPAKEGRLLEPHELAGHQATRAVESVGRTADIPAPPAAAPRRPRRGKRHHRHRDRPRRRRRPPRRPALAHPTRLARLGAGRAALRALRLSTSRRSARPPPPRGQPPPRPHLPCAAVRGCRRWCLAPHALRGVGYSRRRWRQC